MKKLVAVFVLITSAVFSQKLYSDLPIGSHAVGFRIVTIIDSTRVGVPEYNYMGEKNPGNRYKTITLHIWYPSKPGNNGHPLTVRDYSTFRAMKTTDQKLSAGEVTTEVNSTRRSIENFFGKADDDKWELLMKQTLMAQTGLDPLTQKTPLLIGMLRPFSTTVTNEMLASNGFTVVMIRDSGLNTFQSGALIEIPDIQFSIKWMTDEFGIDADNIGTFGFSGSGFTPVLFGMYDRRVKAMADMESAIFGIDYRDSDYYSTRALTIPFMHIYNKELALRDTHFSEFNKMKFSKRYHVVLNQANWHHWNVASEGYFSCTVLKNRGAEQENIRMSFVIANIYLLNFFKTYLQQDAASAKFISSRPVITNIADKIWDVQVLEPLKPGPTMADFESSVRSKGIDEVMGVVRPTLKYDSLSGIWTGFAMNRFGYQLVEEKKLDDALGVFALNAELHPDEANWMDSLSEVYELKGDNANKKKYALRVVEILSAKKELTDFEKGLKENAGRRLR